MKTYQDLISLGEDEGKRKDFVLEVVNKHRNSKDYKTARDAEEYDRHQNVTIKQYQKMLTNLMGQKVKDVYSANHKVFSNFFDRFVTQENQYLLGNGLTLSDKNNKGKLGYDFDMRLVDMGRNALVEGVSFGFWDKDRLRVFKLTEFAPLYDEENGALRAGVRFWQIDNEKPLRMTLYEEDGFTDYILRSEEKKVETLREKRTYIQIVKSSEIDGTEIFDGENYPGFPIIPMWANEHKQSELVGMRESIDCFDLIKSGFANNVDDASEIYWIIKNSGGMDDDVSLAQFIERIKTVHAAAVDSDSGADATANTINIPYEARTALLERLEKDMYNDFMSFNVQQISAGSSTATEINAAYQPFDNKVDKFEMCVVDFLGKLFELIGISDEPKFNRSKITNQLEVTQMVLMAAQYLDDETILSKLPWLTAEEIEKVIKTKIAEDIKRFGFKEDSKYANIAGRTN